MQSYQIGIQARVLKTLRHLFITLGSDHKKAATQNKSSDQNWLVIIWFIPNLAFWHS